MKTGSRTNKNGDFRKKPVNPTGVQTCADCKMVFRHKSVWKRRNKYGISESLCDKCFQSINSKENEMWDAIENGDAEKLKETIAAGADVSDLRNGKSVLDRAINQNKTDCYTATGETIGDILRKNGCPQTTAEISVALPRRRILFKKEQRLEPEKSLYSDL